MACLRSLRQRASSLATTKLSTKRRSSPAGDWGRGFYVYRLAARQTPPGLTHGFFFHRKHFGIQTEIKEFKRWLWVREIRINQALLRRVVHGRPTARLRKQRIFFNRASASAIAGK